MPTAFHHALDLAILGDELVEQSLTTEMHTLILDFKDAFMGVPLHPSEYPYNCCALDHDVTRNRGALYPGEPSAGRFVVWVVLGFGGKANPLVFSRAVSFAARTAQGLLRPTSRAAGHPRAAAGRLQMYVDDPACTVVGSGSACALAADLVILWWLALGLPLAWPKGVWTPGPHRWIGADFTVRRHRGLSAGVVTVPEEFADELYDKLEQFSKGRGHVQDAEVDQLLGKCGRLAYIVPAVRPFVGALWGALAGSKAAQASGRREAPPGRHAARRFTAAARWLRVLLRPPLDAAMHFPLEQIVVREVSPIALDGPRVHVDASLWGAGAVFFLGATPTEFLRITWTDDVARHLKTEVGDPAGQTTFEYLAVYVVLLTWASERAAEGLAILGDNLAALTGALTYRGRGALNSITQEISWRKVRMGWRFAAGHLPSEYNELADCLSRLAAPAGSERKEFPEALRGVPERQAPDLRDIWTCS